MTENLNAEWVPTACSLPTAEAPVRVAEFDDLFREVVVEVEHPSSGELHLKLRATPDNAARAARLAAMETGCCAFFTFALTIADDELDLSVTTGPAHERVLAALGTRARDKAGIAA